MVKTSLVTCVKNIISNFEAIKAVFEVNPYTAESSKLIEHLDFKEMYHSDSSKTSGTTGS